MDPFLLVCDGIPGAIHVVSVRGEEELGQCFDYHVAFVLEDDAGDLDPATVVGSAATLAFAGGSNPARIGAYVAELELLDETMPALYRVRLVPRLWFLRHSAHSRVFVSKATPDVLQAVLTSGGIAADRVDMRLGTATYAPRDHTCQYEESDLAFLERWMERDGLYYFFDHESGDGKVIVCNSPDQHASMADAPIPYFALSKDDESMGQRFWHVRDAVRCLTKQVGVADYAYMTPATAVTATEPVATEVGAEVQRWGENEQAGAGAGAVAKVLAEHELARRERFFAEGDAYGIHAGFTFSVTGHQVAALNRTYLAVRVVHFGQPVGEERGAGLFDEHDRAALGRREHYVVVEAIPATVQYRSPRRAPWPSAFGLSLGRIDGPADDDYAQLDDQGRYLVKLSMDENDSPAGGASTFVRHVQPHGGAPEGWHLPLRKQTEVLIAFVGGDPDRPVIVGSVHNAQNQSLVTKANHTQNVLQTGGRTRIEIEDQEGQQYIDISTPPMSTYVHMGVHAGLGDHNVAMSTAGDGLIHTTGNRDITIGGNQTEDVKGNVTETYHANQTTHVTGAFTETIDAGSTQTIHAGFTQTISGGSKQSIAGGETRTVSGGVTETFNGSRQQSITGSSTETVTGSQTQAITGGATISTAATYTVSADGGITLSTPGPMTMMANTWLMNAAGGQKSVDFMFAKYAGVEMQMFAFVFQPTATVLQAATIQIGVYGARFDIFTKKGELNGILLKNAGSETKIGALEKVQALLMAKCGFHTLAP
ncbi:MAG TPA: type VI secretion system tip protein TssI/VgrG [Polyangiaceae bacterium]|jgi:type VI secretion system secreted protein VgrG